jgi:hypothetical protein
MNSPLMKSINPIVELFYLHPMTTDAASLHCPNCGVRRANGLTLRHKDHKAHKDHVKHNFLVSFVAFVVFVPERAPSAVTGVATRVPRPATRAA